MTVVADANVFLSFALGDEALHSKAQELILSWETQRERVAVPVLFRAEITAVVRKAAFLGRISQEQGRLYLARLLAYPITVYDDDSLLLEAYDLAGVYNRPRAYDTQYAVLARRLNVPFWTADERLFNSLKGGLPLIRWLGAEE